MIDKEDIKDKIKKLRKTGFFSIFISTVFSKVVTLLGSIVLVRILPKNDYGVYSYISNCFTMLFMFNDLGISSATLQYLTESIENKERQRQIIKYSIKSCLIVSIVTCLLVLFSPYFYPYTMEEAKILTPMLFLVPMIMIIYGLLSMILRANFDNRRYGKLQIFITLSTYIVLIIASITWGIKGAILSHYVYSSLILIYSVFLTHKYIPKRTKDEMETNQFDKKEKRSFIKYALSLQLNNTIGSLLITIDTFFIGYIISAPEQIANYSVGSKLPYALNFLSTCIAIYIQPHFIKNNNNINWIKRNFNRLIKYSIIGFAVLCILLIAFSKIIFYILYGTEYYESIPIYIVLVIGLFFTSALKTPCANILYALRKVKINIITNIFSLAVNVITNILFINWFGIIGAAITTTGINIIISSIYIIYLKKYITETEEKTKSPCLKE